ncbi:sigma-54-dependent Fis family transcriptional regulator [Pseudonocardia sp.]|uniref:sigma-54-dependent Fis family transcriptional regulator n=1 Tax=Pseudonocardia sp. TaxID=60912 RepID=UPI003D0BFADE
MRVPAVSDGAVLRRARRALRDGSDLPPDLRGLIRHSWVRSRMSAVGPERLDIPFLGTDARSERLCRAAEPVLGRFAQQLGGTQVSIVLADPHARVVGRWAGDRSALRRLSAVSIEEGFVLGEEVAGTNGIGTALEELAPVLIHGAEHFVEELQRLVCAGVPVRNPLTRRLEGVLNLACPTADANGLLLPTLLDLGTQIEREFSARASERERAVFERFLARSRDTAAPLVAIGEHFLLTNAAAATLLEPADQALLWDQAAESVGEGVAVLRTFVLGSGAQVRARCTPVRVGALGVGALIELTGRGEPPAARTQAPARPGHRSRAWAELERAVRGLDPALVQRVRIVGETGTGKLRLARRLHRERGTGGEPQVLSCGLAAADGSRTWLARAAGALGSPAATVVVTHLELLDASTCAALAELVDAATAALVVTTVRESDGYVPGAERFGYTVLRVPALRHRRDDVPALVQEMLAAAGSPGTKVSSRALAALIAAPWPGNLRQLQAVIGEALTAARGRAVDLAHLPEDIRLGAAGRRRLSPLEELERDAIARALHEHGGNKNKVAEALGMSRSTLYRRLRRFGLDAGRSVL